MEIQLEYLVGKSNPNKGVYEGGVCEPRYLNELMIDIQNEEIFDFEKDAFIELENRIIHFSGSRRAFKELGRYLIALSKYETEDPDYHDHFDEVGSINSESKNKIVFHGCKSDE